MRLDETAKLPMAGTLEACGGCTTSHMCACRLSELRTLELSDGLCKQLDAYEYQPPTDSDPEGSWLRFSKPDKTTEERTQAHQRTQQVCAVSLHNLAVRIAVIWAKRHTLICS